MTQINKTKEELVLEVVLLQKRIGELEALAEERKKSEEKFGNSKKLLQRIIDLLPIRIFWKDAHLRYLGCNEIFAKDAGEKRAEDLIGKDDFQMSWKEQAQMYRDDDQRVLLSGKAKLNFEEPQTTPQGNQIWLKTSKVAIRDSHGNAVGVLGTYEEITDRKRMENLFRQNEEKILSITNSSQDAILGMNAQGRIDFWNPAASRILGYTADEAMGMDLHKLIVPERYRQAQAAAYPEFLRSGTGAAIGKTLELAAIRKDGIEIAISLTLSAIKRSEGWCAVGVIRDITETKQLQDEKNQLYGIMQQMPLSVVITNRKGEIEYTNPFFSQITGYSSQEALGNNPRILKSGEQPVEFYKDLWSTILSGNEWRGELHNKKKNGECFWETATIAPLRNGQGEITHFIAVKEDTTEKRKLNEETRKHLLEMQIFFKASIGREERILELKKEIQLLKDKARAS